MICGCEQAACIHTQQDSMCPNPVTASSPVMRYAGTICQPCADVLTSTGGASWLNASDKAEAYAKCFGATSVTVEDGTDTGSWVQDSEKAIAHANEYRQRAWAERQA